MKTLTLSNPNVMCTRAQEEGRSECNERDSEVVLGRERERRDGGSRQCGRRDREAECGPVAAGEGASGIGTIGFTR